MKVTFSNIAGGNRQTRTTLASLARHSVDAPFGGWEIHECEGISERDARAVLVWATCYADDYRFCVGHYPRTAKEWEGIADDAIATPLNCEEVCDVEQG